LKKAETKMTLSRTWIPTICLLAGVAAAQPTPPPPAAPRVFLESDDVSPFPSPRAMPAPPAPPAAAWDLDVPPVPAVRASRPVPPAPPARRPVIAWATPAAAPEPPQPPGFSQDAVPTPRPFPAPAAVPAPPAPPADFNFDYDFDQKFNFNFDKDSFKFDQDNFKYELKEQLRDQMYQLKAIPGMLADADLLSSKIAGQFAFAPQKGRLGQNDDRLYNAGQSALENRRYEEAVEDFGQVAARAGSRADGALYWKAYALIKLNRRNDALAAIAELRKSYASSRWLDDAKSLEVEAGKPVSPEGESDEELKLLALNGLMNSEPERAFPILETLLKGAQSPTLKKRAVFVLAQSNLPQAQTLLEQIARGSANPDLQLKAIQYVGERRRNSGGGQLLAEIYTASNDTSVKRTVLNSFGSMRDKDHLLQVAKSEKSPELRLEAIRMLSGMNGASAELWQLYQAEPSGDTKLEILQTLPSSGNMDRFLDIAKTEKDVKVRRFAIQQLGNSRAITTGDALASLYASEQDQEVKRAVIDTLSGQRNAKALVACAKSEKDYRMQQRIIERLVGIKSPESTDYLMEILKK
jgi:hypothetical protein